MKRSSRLVVSTVLALALTSGIASAQDYGPPPPPPGGGGPQPAYQPPPVGPQRLGLTFGGDIGIGVMTADCQSCDDTLGAGQFGWHIGLMLNPIFAVVYDGHAAFHPFDDGFGDTAYLIQSIHTIAAQYWVAPQIWVKGGLGFAFLTFSSYDFEANSETVGALLLAAGYEFLQAPNFALEGVFKVGAGFYGEDTGQDTAVTNVTFNIGASWY